MKINFLLFIFIVVLVYLVVLCVTAFLVGSALQRKGKNSSPWRWGIFGVGVVIAAAIFFWKWFVNPLPSDEYMIEHFNKNRAAYEELVAGYVDARSKDEEVMKAWMGNPRKMELQRLVKAKDDMVNPESSQWYGGVIPHSGSGERKKIIYSVEFRIESGAASSLREKSIVWKSYWYFPEPPKLTYDGFCRKNSKAERCLNKSNTGILNNLDGYPMFPHAERGCGDYMRKIDEHWFIRYVKACF